MSFLSNRDQEQEGVQEETRWTQVLGQVSGEKKTGRPWWQNVLVFLGWAGGFAGSAAVVIVVLVLIADLLSRERLFTARILSDWLFWSSALLMLLGLVAPSSSDIQEATDKRKRESKRQENRATRSIRRRLRRVYDPWRWRLWGSALLEFGLSALIGLLG